MGVHVGYLREKHETLGYVKKSAVLMNTARAICDRDAVATLSSSQIIAYVWDCDPWRYMRNTLGGGNGMLPHYSGTTIDAQASSRYANSAKKIFENFFDHTLHDLANIIVDGGEYTTKAYCQR